MAINKLTVLLPLTLMMLGASAVPVANVPSGSVEKRGYDGDWLYSRESGTAVRPTYKNIADENLVIVNEDAKVAEKRGYDGDWLYSRKTRNAEAKKPGHTKE